MQKRQGNTGCAGADPLCAAVGVCCEVANSKQYAYTPGARWDTPGHTARTTSRVCNM